MNPLQQIARFYNGIACEDLSHLEKQILQVLAKLRLVTMIERPDCDGGDYIQTIEENTHDQTS